MRAGLEPLGEGERPAAVTVGAIVAFLLAAANLIAYVAGMKIDGERPAMAGIFVYEGLLLAAAYGMWRARYWAVLGMQTLLALTIVFSALALVQAVNWWAFVLVSLILVLAGALFWCLIKAMARIQMPERPGSS